MRSDAAQNLHAYDMRPVTDDIYMCDVLDRGGKMIAALRDWEKRRGITFTFNKKYTEKSPQTETTKPKKQTHEKCNRKPGRPTTLTEEERRERKRQKNKEWNAANREHNKAKSKAWRASRTPEQKLYTNQVRREWRARKRAANKSGSVRHAGMPLRDAAVS